MKRSGMFLLFPHIKFEIGYLKIQPPRPKDFTSLYEVKESKYP